MKDLYIIGAGGCGRDFSWYFERQNMISNEWNIVGFIDDNEDIQNKVISGYPVVGTTEDLLKINQEIYVICAIGNGKVRKRIIEKIKNNSNIHFPTIIDPSAIISGNLSVGEGSVIGPQVVIHVDATVGAHSLVNSLSSVGHDVVIGDFVTAHPGVYLSGNVTVDECVELGTGTRVIQGLHICKNVVCGAGSVVVRNIEEEGTYVGVPVRKL